MCIRFRCLPNPGGLFQQDRNHIKKMERVLQAHQKYEDQQEKARKREPPKEDES